jgi:hypothetical protein
MPCMAVVRWSLYDVPVISKNPQRAFSYIVIKATLFAETLQEALLCLMNSLFLPVSRPFTIVANFEFWCSQRICGYMFVEISHTNSQLIRNTSYNDSAYREVGVFRSEDFVVPQHANGPYIPIFLASEHMRLRSRQPVYQHGHSMVEISRYQMPLAEYISSSVRPYLPLVCPRERPPNRNRSHSTFLRNGRWL